MKKYYPFLLAVLSFCIGQNAFAQPGQGPVRFTRGDLVAGNNIIAKTFSTASLQASLFTDHYFVLIQFSELPGPSKKAVLKTLGIELGDFLPGQAFLATIKKNIDFSSLDKEGIRSITGIPALYKKDRSLDAFLLYNSKESTQLIAVALFPGVSRAIAEQELSNAGAMIVPVKFSSPQLIFIRPDKNIVDRIASIPFVSFISLQRVTDQPLNYKGMGLHGMSSLQSPSGRNLSGKNVAVGVGDNAEISTHIDFTNRIINRVYNVPSFHGIHTSGTVAGGGILDTKNHGMAPRATIISQWFSDVITSTPTYVADYNMIATNNSYTAADDGCIGNRVYDVLSNYADAQMRNYETVLHVFSAGNDGSYTCTPYPAAYGTVKTGWQCAKNVLTVGAMNQLDYSIASFSSRGPVNDGRIKPEIVASGVSVLSTRHNNSYGNNSGTSMSGPMVAGAATILNERYRALNGGATPKSALIKALLCNSAEDLGNPGPDYTFGFGNLNARRAVEALEGNRYFISTTTPAYYNITVPANERSLKGMLYWNDPAATPNAAITLVNDLDLFVTGPLATDTTLPLILNPSNVTAAAFNAADHTNNIEQVTINNPVAGNYSLNVKAFNVPAGPQEYVLTYQVEMNGITVEYPFGGETVVPGETEVIRWNAYGDDANTFTIDTSFNNGASWGVLNNNVAATARSLSWLVPANLTNNALIRVSRNSSAFTDQSDFGFTILGMPVVTATVPCEGFAQLDWPTITGATSYDIFQLKGDTMSLIGNTAALTYLVGGLNASTTYWFGVAARNGSGRGRRSVSKSALPTTGTCTLGVFDNNFKAHSIDAPVSGRQFTSGALGAAEVIKLTIKNLDNAASAGNYNLSYQVNGNPVVTETSAVSLAALGSLQYSFVQTADFSAPGIYTIRAWVKKAGDAQVNDDTATIIIKHLANPVLTLPVADGFESAIIKDYTANTTGLDSIDKVDFKTNATRGRARTFVNTGFARSGNRAITLDQFPYGTIVTDSMLMTYNASAYNTGNQLRLDFYYKNHGQDNNPNNKVWIRGSDTQPWILAYDLVANQASLGNWKHAIVNVNDVLDTVIPAQPITSSFQVKFRQTAITSTHMAKPILDQDDGYTFDDVLFSEALNDVAITQLVSPSQSGCAMSGVQPVSIRIKNYSAGTFTNVPVSYRVNGGAPVNELVPSIGPNANFIYTFTATVNLTQNADYVFDTWITTPTDNYPGNDSILNFAFHTSPVVSSFPYLEGFESNDGYWYSKGSNNSWQWGTPAKTIINKAANGTKAWVTNLTANYSNNELSYLYSPCFDLSSLTQPVLSFSHIYSIEDGCPCDYTWVEYSTNGGVTWNRLGTNGAGVNWYNDPTGLHQWRTSFNKWHVASLNIPTTASSVRFRFVMASDAGFNTEGVGIDDIHIFDKAAIYTGSTLLNTMQNVSGNNWIHYTSGATRFASINPNGQNLGNTIVDVYPYAGAVRNHNRQYYLNRNIVVRPTLPAAGNVSVRLYFTDAEAKSLIAATGCAPCTKPADPYELGVTKYSGPTVQENGTLLDNLPGGIYQFILASNTEIVPYDNGYYAEFQVSSFSEFWLNNGGANGITPLPLNLISFEAIKQNKIARLVWTTENEMNTARFEVERSANGTQYSAIGTVTALNNGSRNNYELPDLQPLSSQNYYRLKIYDLDGSYQYSPVRRIDFSAAADDITIYPNPVTHQVLNIAASANCTQALVYDAAGKLVKQFNLQGRTNLLKLEGIAKGVYQLKVVSNNSVHTKKFLIE